MYIEFAVEAHIRKKLSRVSVCIHTRNRMCVCRSNT